MRKRPVLRPTTTLHLLWSLRRMNLHLSTSRPRARRWKTPSRTAPFHPTRWRRSPRRWSSSGLLRASVHSQSVEMIHKLCCHCWCKERSQNGWRRGFHHISSINFIMVHGLSKVKTIPIHLTAWETTNSDWSVLFLCIFILKTTWAS